jgi:hypothetical protein
VDSQDFVKHGWQIELKDLKCGEQIGKGQFGGQSKLLVVNYAVLFQVTVGFYMIPDHRLALYIKVLIKFILLEVPDSVFSYGACWGLCCKGMVTHNLKYSEKIL